MNNSILTGNIPKQLVQFFLPIWFGTLFQQLLLCQQQMLQLAQIVDRDHGTNMAEQIAAGITGDAPAGPTSGNGKETSKAVSETEALGGEGSGESSTTKKARQRVADSTSPT